MQTKIQELAKDGFNCSDYKALQDYILTNKQERAFKQFMEQGEHVNLKKLNAFIATSSSVSDFNPDDCTVTVSKKIDVNVFLENSGSMDGYVRGITEYEAALADIVVEARHHYGEDNLSINFVNTDVFPVKLDSNISHFFSSLEPKKGPYVVGNQSVSELNELFSKILERTSKNEISIFISDCIYSLDKSRSTLQGLVFQQSLTKAVFLEKSKEFPLSAFVLQMESSFNGKYYDKDNKVVMLSNEKRPYYIWILGEDTAVRDFLDKKDLTKYKGFKNSYFFTGQPNNNLQHEVLARTATKGRFAVNRKDKSIIDHIKLKEPEFQFTLAVDFSNYPDHKTLLNKASYKITPGFEIVNVQKIPENNQPLLVDANDWNTISNKGYSHIVTVRTVEPNFPSDFSLAFINSLPTWIESSNIDDDSNIVEALDKTFGLKYLFAGVQGAYETIGITAATIKLTLNKK